MDQPVTEEEEEAISMASNEAADEALRVRDDGPGPRRILVIEDNEDVAESLREMLELDAHEVTVAFNGAAGLEVLRRVRPDVVLCDIGLPGMDGYQVAAAIRADAALRDVHLVAVSGYAAPEHLARARAAGFDRHLSKPLSIEKLEALLATVPSRRRG